MTETLTFERFQDEMVKVAKRLLGASAPKDDDLIALYHDSSWREAYDNGCTPEDAVRADMEYWED